MEIYNFSKNVTLASNAVLADHFFPRLVGLLNRSSLNEGEGLILKPCKAVHTWLMRFSIDVLFLAKDGKVIHIIENMSPGKKSPYINKCLQVIELPTGTINFSDTKLGDIIICREVI